MSLEKSFDAISEEDLTILIAQNSGDAKAIELRDELPRQSNHDKLDFLNELASFANGLGGYLIYCGAVERGPRAQLSGVETDAAMASIPWLGQLAHTGIAPRIVGLRMRVVGLSHNKSALLVHIPQSCTGPHMVTFHHVNKFCSRNAMGKYLLEVDELRGAFVRRESLAERMRAFRVERANAVLDHGLSVQMSDGPKVMLHILPVNSFNPGFRIALENVLPGKAQMVRPMQAHGVVGHYNYDGLMAFSSVEKYAYSYVQVFRNGCLEATDGMMLAPRDGRRNFPSAHFEQEIIQCGERLLELVRELKIDPPYVVMLSFLNVRGYNMFVGSMRFQASAHPIERDHLFLDEIIIDNPAQDFARAMRPAFDHVWNSCGWAQSMNYDAAGNWQKPKN